MKMLKLTKDTIHFKYIVQDKKDTWEQERKQLKAMRTV
jgi:hypothetical protein